MLAVIRMLIVAVVAACTPSMYRTEVPPPSHAMAAAVAVGTWQSNFGYVTIEEDGSRGGLELGAVSGAWTYADPDSLHEVTGHFSGTLQGSVLRLRWQEGEELGDGFLEFAATGESYTGKWWNAERSKTGMWFGWRMTPGSEE